MQTPSKRTERHGQITALTTKCLEALTPADLKVLREFADRRLGKLPRNRFSAEDAVQKALLSVVLGTGKSGLGRQPNIEHVQSKNAFLHYLRSAINSVIDGMGRDRELLYFHESIHETKQSKECHTTIVLTADASTDADAGMIDLKQELFKRLRRDAHRKLLPVIDEWEKTFFWANHVPCRRKRDFVRQVRLLAMQILKELAEDLRR